MRVLALSLALCAIPAAGQTFTLGRSSDPCQGGNPLTIANSTATVRWGDFTCTLQIQQSTPPAPPPIDGPYTVRLEFLEPCAQLNACAGGQVTKAGQRSESVTVNGTPVLSNLDPFAAGATDTAPAVRNFLLYPISGNFTVRVQTILRSGVLSRVVLLPATIPWSTNSGIGKGLTVQGGILQIDSSVPQTGSDNAWAGRNDFGAATFFGLPRVTADPGTCTEGQMWVTAGVLRVCLAGMARSFVPSPVAIARAVCVGKGPGTAGSLPWDCTGLELYTIGTAAYVAVPATPESLAVPTCPGPPDKACWQPAILGQ